MNIKNPPIKAKQFTLPSNIYEITSQQFLHFYYVGQQSAYQMEVLVSDQQNFTYQALTEKELEKLGCSVNCAYCSLYPIAEQIKLIDDSFFTSMTILQAQNSSIIRILVADNNFILREVKLTNQCFNKINITNLNQTQNHQSKFTPDIIKLEFSNFLLDLSNYLNFTKDDMKLHQPIILNHQSTNTQFIITAFGCLRIKSITNEEIEIEIEQKFIKRNNLLHAIIVKNFLITANGPDGVDLYAIDQNGMISAIKTLLPSEDFPGTVDIIDINYYSSRKILMVLDKINGLYLFTSDNMMKNNRLIQNIPGTGGKAFDFYKTTAIIIYERKNNQDLIVEYFINYNNGDYFINNIFSEYFVFNIEMTPNYAILMTSDTNIIYQHSIYNGFYDITKLPTEQFIDYGLTQVSFVSQKDEMHSFLIGLGMNSIVIYSYYEHPPSFTCQSKIPYKLNFEIKLKSTYCTPSADSEFLFFVCEIIHQFTIDIEQILIDSQHEFLATLFCIILGIFLISILVIAFYQYWKLDQSVRIKEQEYENFQGFEMIESPFPKA